MIKILRVGDPHVRISNLEESEALMQFTLEMAKLHKVNRIELLGDLFHTHAVLRLEVITFWNKWLDLLSDNLETVVLVGNHDQSGDYNSQDNALQVFSRIHKPTLLIIHVPTSIGPFAYMPYIHDNEKFIQSANNLAEFMNTKTLVCHATFDGSKYDNGMYAPGGIDPLKLAYKLIISGHIHSTQKYTTVAGQQVIYPGTARWDSLSDANQVKGIWLYQHDDEGKILSEEMLYTGHICKPIISVEWKEGEEAPEIRPNSRTTVELIGSSDWISKQKAQYKGTGIGVKSRITDQKRAENRKNGLNLADFMKNVFITTMNKEELETKAKEWGLV